MNYGSIGYVTVSGDLNFELVYKFSDRCTGLHVFLLL